MRFSFDPDSLLMRTLSRVADLALLNVVFLLTCLPIFTIGAANTALYTVVFTMDTGREGKLLSGYFRAFRDNFRQSTLLWLIILLFGASTYVYMVQFSALGGSLGYVLLVLATAILVTLLMVFSYAFPLFSQFSNTIRATATNSLLLAVAYLPRSVILLVINCFPWVLLFMNLYAFIHLGFLWFILYFAAAAYLNSRVLLKVFQPLREKAESSR